MVRQRCPGRTLHHAGGIDLKTANVDTIQSEERKQRRKGSGCHRFGNLTGQSGKITPFSVLFHVQFIEHFLDLQGPHQKTRQFIVPVVEVACNNHRRILGSGSLHRPDQGTCLPDPAAIEKAEMNDVTIHFRFRRLQNAVQDPARFERMIGNILIELGNDRIGTQQGITMMTVVINGILAVGTLKRVDGKIGMLPLFLP